MCERWCRWVSFDSLSFLFSATGRRSSISFRPYRRTPAGVVSRPLQRSRPVYRKKASNRADPVRRRKSSKLPGSPGTRRSATADMPYPCAAASKGDFWQVLFWDNVPSNQAMARRDVTAARRASSALPESDIAVCIHTKTCGGAGLAATLKAGGLCASDDPCTTQ